MRLMILLSALALAACASTATRQDKLSVAVARAAERTAPEYAHAFTDLNDDGARDALVLLRDRGWCGSGGCTMLVFAGGDAGYTVISRSTVTNAPIRIAQSTSHGWHDIIVHSDGANKLMHFDGSGYPLNPSMQSAATPAQTDAARIVMP